MLITSAAQTVEKDSQSKEPTEFQVLDNEILIFNSSLLIPEKCGSKYSQLFQDPQSFNKF